MLPHELRIEEAKKRTAQDHDRRVAAEHDRRLAAWIRDHADARRFTQLRYVEGVIRRVFDPLALADAIERGEYLPRWADVSTYRVNRTEDGYPDGTWGACLTTRGWKLKDGGFPSRESAEKWALAQAPADARVLRARDGERLR